MKRNINLTNPERYADVTPISTAKINSAIERAVQKLCSKADIYAKLFPASASVEYKYPMGSNNNWVTGLHTGTYILAYRLTGEKKFLDIAQKHLKSYVERLETKTELFSHDVGFVYSPSCVLLYKLTGNKKARNCAIDAANHLYDFSYSKKGGFILRLAARTKDDKGCRTMMDTLLNIPLFFWAYEETGDTKFLEAAISQVNITDKYLIRKDGSSNHHYQFDMQSHAPVRGVTLQGFSDESTWSRGHSWGVLGFPIAYSYTKNADYLDTFRDVTNYMLNCLPSNNVPYWDYCFADGADEPTDTSASVIAVCGIMEALKHISPGSCEYAIYKNAASLLLETVIDKYSFEKDFEFDGLIHGVTASKPHNMGINGCAVYGDYFYLEALCRYLNPKAEYRW